MKIPKKWYIKGCVELEEWGRKQKEVNCAFSFPYNYHTHDYNLLIWDYSEYLEDVVGYTEITFEEFEKYILNKQTDVPEDYKYLTTFLKKLKIK